MDTRNINMNVSNLLTTCKQELCEKEYDFNRHRLITQYWDEFAKWMCENVMKI